MKTDLKFESLTAFTDHFKDEETCRKHFATIRFANGEYCPHCKHDKIYTFRGGKRYRCASCKEDFTIITKTVFGESKIPLRKWFVAIYLLTTTSKGISSVQLSKHAKVTQKTAWFMDHRLREAMKQTGGQLFGTLEADESVIGGLEENKHKSKRLNKGTGAVGKIMVFGICARGGEMRTTILKSTKSHDLQSAVKAYAASGSVLYTDSWSGYKGLKDYKHAFVSHSKGEYARGDVHTNSIESFWALFKRGYHGVYHQMSPKHLLRYLDEFCFRFNLREEDSQAKFSATVSRVADSQHLSYNALIQKQP